MDILPIVERIGENPTSALFGLLTGVLFGVSAQRSRFCLRMATVEFARGLMGPAVTVWLLTFSTALFWVQISDYIGIFRPEDARMMAVPGTWSGAIIGGLLFGIGMVLARGCSGRLLVLASTGNLRALVSGLIVAVVAQMSLHGWLAPLRDWLAKLWLTPDGRNVDLLDAIGLPDWFGIAAGFAMAAFAIAVALKNKMPIARLFFASGVGFSVAVGWVLTYTLANVSFEPMVITSTTFTGPSANTLMYFLTSDPVLEFDIGLVPGVFIGALVSSLLAREFQFQGFTDESYMRRSMTGAVLMGFGGMLAGGCAIGNGVTGTSIFTATSWLALFAMWVGAMVTDFLLDQPALRQATA